MKITHVHKEQMEANITEEEINAVVSSLKTNKVPGNDGYPAKF